MRIANVYSRYLYYVILTIYSLCCWSDNTAMVIIPLQNRTAEEMQSLVRPLLDAKEHIIAHSSQIIVKSKSAKIEEIKRLIRQLDTPIARFQITLMQGNNLSSEKLNAEASINVQTKAAAYPRISSRTETTINQTLSQKNLKRVQTITTLEGKSAVIKLGNINTAPQQSSYFIGYGGINNSRSDILIETSTGFSVTPRMSGKRKAKLDISPWSDQLTNQGQITTQSATMSLVTEIGKWIEIGGTDQQSNLARRSILSSTRSNLSQQSKILLKVDRLK